MNFLSGAAGGCEAVMEAVQTSLDSQPEAMTLRKCTVEHVFGTLKHSMRWTHSLMRGMENVATKMSRNLLAYNLKRAISNVWMVNMRVVATTKRHLLPMASRNKNRQTTAVKSRSIGVSAPALFRSRFSPVRLI